MLLRWPRSENALEQSLSPHHSDEPILDEVVAHFLLHHRCVDQILHQTPASNRIQILIRKYWPAQNVFLSEISNIRRSCNLVRPGWNSTRHGLQSCDRMVRRALAHPCRGALKHLIPASQGRHQLQSTHYSYNEYVLASINARRKSPI
jgi:hypothetical protein